MTPAALFTLHERLILDTASPFDTDRLSPEGGRWLDDWRIYLETRAYLEAAGQDPDTLLHERYGYIIEKVEVKEPATPPHNNGRRRFKWKQGPPIVFYQDKERHTA